MKIFFNHRSQGICPSLKIFFIYENYFAFPLASLLQFAYYDGDEHLCALFRALE